MPTRIRPLLVFIAVIAGALALVLYFVSIGGGMASAVSNCNRDCDDGSGKLVAALVLGGVSLAALVVLVFGPTRPEPRPVLPEARVKPK